jgi:predicted lipoprotein with Yx(FWY)xxD motif
MTLYYFQPDTASKAACTGSCAQTWPPLLFTGTGSPTLEGEIQGTINGKQVTYNGATLSRELEVHPNANGKQVTYNGHPLYTYSGDTGPSQTRGDGFAGKWSVVPPDIAKNAP